MYIDILVLMLMIILYKLLCSEVYKRDRIMSLSEQKIVRLYCQTVEFGVGLWIRARVGITPGLRVVLMIQGLGLVGQRDSEVEERDSRVDGARKEEKRRVGLKADRVDSSSCSYLLFADKRVYFLQGLQVEEFQSALHSAPDHLLSGPVHSHAPDPLLHKQSVVVLFLAQTNILLYIGFVYIPPQMFIVLSREQLSTISRFTNIT